MYCGYKQAVMKRVLIITYYWPPSGGSGVQRWLKMSKYLPENDWQPVIYTTENAEYPILDPSLQKDVSPEAEVIRQPIVEPYTLYKRFVGMRADEKVKVGFTDESGKQKGWKTRLSVWIRGNLFIPDARRWWIRPSIKYLLKYLKDNPVDAIISTGPPHSMHLIALRLKAKLGLPWIADFRDPWTDIDFYNELRLTKWADCKHHRLEHKVLTKADKVVTVSWNWASGLGKLGNRNVDVIQNGYDWECNPNEKKGVLSDEFSVTHLGVIGSTRNAPVLWHALQELMDEIDGFSNRLKIKLVGQVDRTVVENLNSCNLMDNVVLIPHVHHDDVKQIQESSQVLLLLVNNAPNAKGILTGKLYEYLASGRPILAIGPEDGDAARLLDETKAGVMVEFEDKEKMKVAVKDLYDKYLDNRLLYIDNAEIEKYSRRALAGEYAKMLDTIAEKCTQ